MKNYNISQTLAEMAERLPDKPALITRAPGGYRRWTFRELDENSSAYAHGLRSLGITEADRAVLMVKPSMEFICLTFALFRLGVPVILIDPGMGYNNLLRCIARVRPTVFIGIPRAQFFRLLNPGHFSSVNRSICVGFNPGFLGESLEGIADFSRGPFPTSATAKDDLAAIIFTTGSTGPPKGVRYPHGVFQAQLALVGNYYGVTPADTDQPAFPLFGLFAVALGAGVVIPEMNPARPARVNPARFIRTIIEQKVSYSFGSPAIWNVVSRHCLKRGIILDSLRLVLMAGAPVPGELIERVRKILPPGALIHTPYGATESLPVASISSDELLAENVSLGKERRGICVGRALPGNNIKIIKISDAPLDWSEVVELAVGEIGEIIVSGPVVTPSYDNNDDEDRLAKIRENGRLWHRMGDLGYLDDRGRLWFCGRRAHRVRTGFGEMYTIPCEAVFNEHPAVYRSALVGVREGGGTEETPVIIVELYRRRKIDRQKLFRELAELAAANPLTSPIRRFLIHRSLPVDIRHNAKIFREKLAIWAEAELLGKGRCR